MDERPALQEALRQVDFNALTRQLLAFTSARCRGLVWRSVAADAIPGGIEVDDLVHDGFVRALQRFDAWNHPDESIEQFLFRAASGYIRGRVNHLAESVENRDTTRLSTEDGTSRPTAADAVWVTEILASLVNPVERRIVESILDDEGLSYQDLAWELGVRLADIHNAVKRLRRRESLVTGARATASVRMCR